MARPGLFSNQGEVTVEVRSQPIVLDSIDPIEPDTEWDYTDDAGHYHWWNTEDQKRPRTPTLISVLDDEWTDGDGDEHSESHIECRLCGEHINPGMRSAPARTVLPGPIQTCLRTGDTEVEITSDEYQALRAFHNGSGPQYADGYARKLLAQRGVTP